MKIFVTGGTGFIGGALTRKLIARGNEVRLLIRDRDSTIEKDFPGIQAVIGDLSNVEKLRKGMKGCHQVYHLAALAKHWARNPQDFYQANTLGTQNLLENVLNLPSNSLTFKGLSHYNSKLRIGLWVRPKSSIL